METAKLFTDGCRQIVLLPEAYCFHGNEVYIKKITEGLLLIPKDRSSPEAVIREIKQSPQNTETVHSASGLLAEYLADSSEIPDPCFNVEEWNRQWDRIEAKMERYELAENELL